MPLLRRGPWCRCLSIVSYSVEVAHDFQPEVMAKVLGPEIVVNAVCPGFIEGRWLREGAKSLISDVPWAM